MTKSKKLKIVDLEDIVINSARRKNELRARKIKSFQKNSVETMSYKGLIIDEFWKFNNSLKVLIPREEIITRKQNNCRALEFKNRKGIK